MPAMPAHRAARSSSALSSELSWVELAQAGVRTAMKRATAENPTIFLNIRSSYQRGGGEWWRVYEGRCVYCQRLHCTNSASGDFSYGFRQFVNRNVAPSLIPRR